MNLFDKLVKEALAKKPDLAPLKIAVEKELLHQDILRILQNHNFLSHLTFIGGTCLRICYGGARLSEDLDFTGGRNFSRKQFDLMGQTITHELGKKYGLRVTVKEPYKETLNVDTWKIRIETRPETKYAPPQRINIDVCATSSYEKKPMMLFNPYGIDMGTYGLIIQAQSAEEIYTDKLLAFALRPNRIKYRDIWDIMWLEQSTIQPNLDLIAPKLTERNHTLNHFKKLFLLRLEELKKSNTQTTFIKEMQRFLPQDQIEKTIGQKDFIRVALQVFEKFMTLL